MFFELCRYPSPPKTVVSRRRIPRFLLNFSFNEVSSLLISVLLSGAEIAIVSLIAVANSSNRLFSSFVAPYVSLNLH